MKWNELTNISKEPQDFIELLKMDNELTDDLQKLLNFLIESVNKKIQDKYLISIKKTPPATLGQINFIPKFLKANSKRRNLITVSCYSRHLYVKTFMGSIYRIIYKDNNFTFERIKNADVDFNNFNLALNKKNIKYDTFLNDIEKQYQAIKTGTKREYKKKSKSNFKDSYKVDSEEVIKSLFKFKGEIKSNAIGKLKITDDLLKLANLKFKQTQTFIVKNMLVIKELNNSCILCNKEIENVRWNICICDNCYFLLCEQQIVAEKFSSNLTIPQINTVDEENSLIINIQFLEILNIGANTVLEIYIFENYIILKKL